MPDTDPYEIARKALATCPDFDGRDVPNVPAIHLREALRAIVAAGKARAVIPAIHSRWMHKELGATGTVCTVWDDLSVSILWDCGSTTICVSHASLMADYTLEREQEAE